MRKQLQELKITNFYDCDFLFSELKLDMNECKTTWSPERSKEQTDLYMYSVLSQKQKEVLKVNSIDLVLTEKCSLKCKDCANLMQYYAKPIDEDYEQLTSSLDQFMNTIDYVREIRIIGGEPLIYKKIDLIVKQLLTYKNFDKIYVYTN